MKLSAYTITRMNLSAALISSAIALTSASPGLKAATIVFSNQVNSVETSVNAVQSSAFFTATPDNGFIFTNIATVISPGLIGGDLGAGDGSLATSSGTITIVGGSTSAGNWTDSNGIPAGITLTFNVQFTTATTNGFLTLGGNGLVTATGNGIGITNTAAVPGALDVGEVLEISTISITGVNFTGSLAESGYSFTPGTVLNPKWNRLRSNNFAEATRGATITTGTNVWGFGQSTGNAGTKMFIENNYTQTNALTFISAGPLTIETQLGSWNLKGLGFQYQVTYDINAVANLVLDTPVQNGGSLTVSGSGPANTSYALLESTDISAPRTSWGTNTVGTLDAGGRFTNSVSRTGSAKFYMLKTP
jgi:hypothetical protein